MSTCKKRPNTIKAYSDALNYLFSNTNYETAKRVRYNKDTFNLDRMTRLLEGIGNPHKKIKTIHIAGSKGKGSTCTMLSEMLIANGLNVGLYTSPHVIELRERIRINGEMITEEDMTKLVKKTSTAVKKMTDDKPTFFEILTAIAFLYFASQKTDVNIIETGMGGRLDSTNVLVPEVVGITSMSLDHQSQLGNNLSKIAREKAGIFKKGIPAYSVMQDSEVMRVLKREATTIGAPLKFAGKDIDFSYRFESSRSLGPHNRVCLTTANSRFEHLPVPLLGEHQAINCGLALTLMDSLKSRGYELSDRKSMIGLTNVKLPGRMEIIWDDPRILVDGAHNAASIKALIQATGQHIPYDSMVVIFACCEDKDIDGMLEQLQYGADKVIFTRVKSPRSAYPEDLAQRYGEICGKMCQTASSLEEALQIARPAINTGDLICVTGSFYLVGQAKCMFADAEKVCI